MRSVERHIAAKGHLRGLKIKEVGGAECAIAAESVRVISGKIDIFTGDGLDIREISQDDQPQLSSGDTAIHQLTLVETVAINGDLIDIDPVCGNPAHRSDGKVITIHIVVQDHVSLDDYVRGAGIWHDSPHPGGRIHPVSPIRGRHDIRPKDKRQQAE